MSNDTSERPVFGVELLPDGDNQLADVSYQKNLKPGVGRITVDRPEVLNAWRHETVRSVVRALLDCHLDRSIGVVVLSGAGKRSFCAGGDIKQGRNESPEKLAIYQEVHQSIRTCLKPIIARVNGNCIGMGHHIAYHCDLTIAADHALFGQNGANVGSPIGGFPVNYLARIIGHKRAREMWYACKRYSAAQMLDWGLVNAVVPYEELDAEVDRWCDTLLDKSPNSLRLAKATFERDIDLMRDSNTFGEVCPDFFLAGGSSAELQEGLDAFIEKRKPDWAKFRRRDDRR
ncbi:MAG: enoyl-CoA hydratase/isomerase family protein [Pseudomonadales bacterium]|jgi:dihydroxynaphthoic acid synthetase|nr:enoyl-CoA hydratase/isomerase family protein [Pseudomonadales bacterium]MCP5320323.1 enoyl-CoA hydratase/isomerase family protein [Pseudomonadales bacterium]MCP5338001.1 enoyl-CoA hydratase/isomerase family protein [Pseudomonadales bacterium]